MVSNQTCETSGINWNGLVIVKLEVQLVIWVYTLMASGSDCKRKLELYAKLNFWLLDKVTDWDSWI